MPAAAPPARDPCRLYLVTPAHLDPAAFAPLLARALDGGDVAAVQLRLKHADDAQIIAAIGALRPVAQSRGVAFLLNDRPDLVRPHGCDGVHVGQTDMKPRDARAAIGPDLTLGVTCHASRDLAMTAGQDGADYVAFGAFYPSATKPQAELADPALLSWWSALMELPCVAIGGIDATNAACLVQAGADFLAVSHAVWSHPDPGVAIATLHRVIAESAQA